MDKFTKDPSLMNGKGENDVDWITVNGRHIPIKDGENPKEAIQRQFGDSDNKKDQQTKSFGEQVDEVLSGADTNNTHLKVMETPQVLKDIGFKDLPILMTAKHLKTITQASGDNNCNYHNIKIDIVKKLPQLISSPVMIMKSMTRNDSVVVLTEAYDSENRPIIAAIKFIGKGRIDNLEVKANILTSAYGRNNFQSFLEKNILNNNVLYTDKKKIQELFYSLGIQFPNEVINLVSNNIIRKFIPKVNK